MGKFTDDKFKAPRRTIQDDVDRLIDWYETNKPSAARTIEVEATESDLEKFCMRGADKQLWYRGRVLEPVKEKSMSAKKYAEKNQARI